MIRKPTEKDFKESTAVSALRESKRVAQASGQGLQRGVQSAAKIWLIGMCWFGVAVTAIPAISEGKVVAGLLLVALAFGFQKLIGWIAGVSAAKEGAASSALPDTISPHELMSGATSASRLDGPGGLPLRGSPVIRQSGSHDLDPATSVRQAVTFLVPGLLATLLGVGMWPLLVPGLALVATAIMIFAKLVSDKNLLRFDHREVRVSTLLATRTLAWSDVVNVSAKVYSRFNLKVLLTIGSRRAIVLTARDDGHQLVDVLVPIDLLNLEKEGLTALVANLLSCSAAAGEKVPAWQEPGVVRDDHCPPVDTGISFDPDAIIARHMAERDALLAAEQERRNDYASPQQFGRKTFGRKVA